MDKITIIGNLGSDPEMRYTQGGDAVTSFSVASNRRWKNKDGESQEEVTWFRVTCWRKLAEVAGEYLEKGKQVYVEGRVKVNTYENRNGERQASLEVTANDIQFLGGSPGGQQRDENRGSGQQQGNRQNNGGNRQQGGDNRQSSNRQDEGGGNRSNRRDDEGEGGGNQRQDDNGGDGWDNVDDLPF